MSAIIIDCHVHLYPRHDEGVLFSAALNSFSKLAPEASGVLLLAERGDCDRFSGLSAGVNPPAGFAFENCGAGAVRVRERYSGKDLLVISGFQIATRERLEVLALCCTTRVPDGLALEDTVGQVRNAGGLPVLAWAPGKWLGERRQIIRRFLDREREEGKSCDDLLLCDTTLRPRGWPEPRLFTEFQNKGGRLLAGSDPLPIAGDESQVGKFAVVIETAEPVPENAAGMRGLLINRGAEVRTIGVRNNPVEWFTRYSNFMMSKRSK